MPSITYFLQRQLKDRLIRLNAEWEKSNLPSNFGGERVWNVDLIKERKWRSGKHEERGNSLFAIPKRRVLRRDVPE